MKVLDLFSGIGGFSYGLEMASKNFKTTKFCEIDKFCQKVLKKHWPEVPIHDDIKTLTCTEGEYDIICGGFPCQDISVAGQKKGITNETRSGLWYEYKRIIKEVKPRYVIIENVRNLLNNGLAIVLKDLHEIGYNAEWEVISARSVGACHLRERLWIVAYPNTTRRMRPDASQPKERWGNTKSFGGSGKSKGITTPTYSNSKRLQRQFQKPREDGNLGREEVSMRADGLLRETPPNTSNSDNFRFWPSFVTEEEKSEWWSKATSGFRDWWEAESSICRVSNGISKELDKDRANRIKALGNSIVPQIVKIIGDRIVEVSNEQGE